MQNSGPQGLAIAGEPLIGRHHFGTDPNLRLPGLARPEKKTPVPALDLTPRLILASRSPRRLSLLRAVGLSPKIMPADIDESPRADEQPKPYAARVALEKAQALLAPPDSVVLAADTVVALGSKILGKAEDDEHAHRLLGMLSGHTHTVHTAVAVLQTVRGKKSPEVYEDLVSTEIRFRSLSDQEIARYVATGEPRDKAGAYGIQGEGGALVASVSGSYTNVVGLPLEESLRLLALAGIG